MRLTTVLCGLLLATLIQVHAQAALVDDASEGALNATERELPIGAAPDDAFDKRRTRKGRPGFSRFEGQDNNETETRREGSRFYWQHDLGSGDTVSERAFAPNGSNVIIMKSRDRSLDSKNITRSTTIYYFSESKTVVAIIPRGRGSSCYIRNSTLSYQGAIDKLAARNGSTVPTTQAVTVDGTGTPLSAEESVLFLEVNPGLRRACGSRLIVVTKDVGDNPEPVSTTVDKVSVLSLEADIDLLVSVASDVPGTSRVGEGRNLSLRTRGRGFWKRFLA